MLNRKNQKAQNIVILTCLIVVLFSQISQFGSVPRVGNTISVPTATPWVKQDILIEIKSGKGIDVWTDNIVTDRRKIDEIEGVINTILMRNNHMIYVQFDPRYDKDLIAKAIAKAIEDRLIKKSFYSLSPLLTH